MKRGTVVKKRHKRLLKKTKGFWGERKNVFKRAKETLLRAMAYAFKGRKLKKRDMRSLFIARIKAESERQGLSYNKFIHGLKQNSIELNKKMLSQLAIYEPEGFAVLADMAKE